MVGGADHAFLLHAFNERGGAVVADLQAALDVGGRGLLVAGDHRHGAVIEIVARGDGYNWEYYKSHATSDSYRGGGVGALTPENYLVSPLINIGSTMDKVMLTFDISAGDEDYPEENYREVISESPITLANCREATILRD